MSHPRYDHLSPAEKKKIAEKIREDFIADGFTVDQPDDTEDGEVTTTFIVAPLKNPAG